MTSILKKFCFIAALCVFYSGSVAPEVSRAQSVGLGWDGYTRQMWRSVAQSVSLWTLDPNLNLVSYVGYGPYGAWAPVALATGNNNYSYLLWRYPGGIATIWKLDGNSNLVSYVVTGAAAGWTPENISTGTSGTNLRLSWRAANGASSIWSYDANLNFLTYNYVPAIGGWDPGPAPEAVLRRPVSVRQSEAMVERLKAVQITPLAARLHAESIQRAAKAMSTHTATKPSPALPTP